MAETAETAVSAEPGFPAPDDNDFDEDISTEERDFYKDKFKELSDVKSHKLHCTACDKHLGCAAKGDGRMRKHPMLRTLVCRACHTFYNSGEFEKGDDGSELYCRWCGQGGQVYCCSACPHVFCAKCIKRNLGQRMIREIESMDDWKCFKCSPRELWDLRATCWALLRFCDLKNKQAYLTQDPELKEKYTKECALDETDCCRKKRSSTTPIAAIKKKTDDDDKKSIIAKIPSGIQVKKFACVNVDNILKGGSEKKAIKRPASPGKLKPSPVRAPIPIAPYPYSKPMVTMPGMPALSSLTGMPGSPMPKKIKIANPPPSIMLNNQRHVEPKKYQRNTARPKIPIMNHSSMVMNPHLLNTMPNPQVLNSPSYNGYTYRPPVPTDNINLSLESLTQGMDMAALANMANSVNSTPEDDVVCTPDFPLEPLCEVSEETADDDVECITPGPTPAPKLPALAPRALNTLPDLNPDNIVQMTDNDVTVNVHTGGLKFRVDPQTLSSNKMYRLPDGRIFAINANPNMPGGYSATIVAVSEQAMKGMPAPPKGATYAAKLSAVVHNPSPPPLTKVVGSRSRPNTSLNSSIDKRNSSTPNKKKSPKPVKNQQVGRNVNMKIPVEWYRYNLVDAVDAVGYSLTRLNKLKKEASTVYLRSRSLDEMKQLHRALERLLNTSVTRFTEVRENLNKGFKEYLRKKGDELSEDDDVEILPPQSPTQINLDDSDDDAVCINENSGSEGVSADNHDDNSNDPEPIANVITEINDSGEQEEINKSDPLAELSESTDNTDITKDKVQSDVDAIEGSLHEKINEGKQNVLPAGDVDNAHQKSDEKVRNSAENETISEEKEAKALEKGAESPAKEAELPEKETESPENEAESPEKEPESPENEAKSPGNNARPLDRDAESQEKEAESAEKEAEFLKNEAVSLEKNSSKNYIISVKDVLHRTESETNSTEKTTQDVEMEDDGEESILGDVLTSSDKEPEKLLEPDVGLDEEKAEKVNIDEVIKLNGSSEKDHLLKGEEAMDVDVNNSLAGVMSNNKNAEDLQMSDEMIDNLLADDVNTDELTADLQKFTEQSLEALAETDFN